MSHFTLLFKHKFDFDNLKREDDIEPIGDKKEVIEMIRNVLPEIEFSDGTWGTYQGEFGYFEIVLGKGDIIRSIGLRNTPSGELTKMLCESMNLFAFDTATSQFI